MSKVDYVATFNEIAKEVQTTGRQVAWGELSKAIFKETNEKVTVSTLRSKYFTEPRPPSIIVNCSPITPKVFLKVPKVIVSYTLTIRYIGVPTYTSVFEVEQSSEYVMAKSLASSIRNSLTFKHTDNWLTLNLFSVALNIIKSSGYQRIYGADNGIEVEVISRR